MTFQPTIPRIATTTTMATMITAGGTSFTLGPPLLRSDQALARAEEVDRRLFGPAIFHVAVAVADVLAVKVAGEVGPVRIERAGPGRIGPEPVVLVEAVRVGNAPQPVMVFRFVRVTRVVAVPALPAGEAGIHVGHQQRLSRAVHRRQLRV